MNRVLFASNDNWIDSPNKQEIIASGLAPKDVREAAILSTLMPGLYTAIVSGVGSTTGVALVEVYDLSQSVESKLVNISTRGSVGTADDVMIGGVIVTGDASRHVLLRAIGPSLPLPGALANPMLELHDGDGNLIDSNDDWRSTQETEIIATGIPPTNDLEAAIVITLEPGNYTAIVRGVNNTSGIALVEAYAIE